MTAPKSQPFGDPRRSCWRDIGRAPSWTFGEPRAKPLGGPLGEPSGSGCINGVRRAVLCNVSRVPTGVEYRQHKWLQVYAEKVH
jgi:hypothetical protein